MKRFFLFFSQLLALSICAQEFSGKVLDEYGLPVNQANVEVLRNNNYTITDAQGNFFLNDLKNGDTLQINHVAFEELYWIIHAEQDRAEITMESSVFSLEEIIISEHNLSLIHI